MNPQITGKSSLPTSNFYFCAGWENENEASLPVAGVHKRHIVADVGEIEGATTLALEMSRIWRGVPEAEWLVHVPVRS